jgi:hypothetical protein
MRLILALAVGFAIAWIYLKGSPATNKTGSDVARADAPVQQDQGSGSTKTNQPLALDPLQAGASLKVPAKGAITTNTPAVSNGSSSESPGIIAQSAPPSSPLPPPPPEVLSAIVTITGSNGAATGFIGRFRGTRFVVTNQHVLGVGSQLTIKTSTGVRLAPKRIAAATDADVALITCDSYPATATDLEIASLHELHVSKDDAVMVPGNSQGDGVITQTSGVLVAVGPHRIEVNTPVYGGNSGSPILHMPTQKVIGVLTEAEIVRLDAFGKASFRSKNSAIKSEIRYFGHRVDSVQKWADLNWAQFQSTEAAIKLARKELNCIVSYFTDGESYKEFRDLHVAHNNAATIYFNRSYSPQDKVGVFNRFLREVEGLAKRAKGRVSEPHAYFSQKDEIKNINRFAELITQATGMAKLDSDLASLFISGGR